MSILESTNHPSPNCPKYPSKPHYPTKTAPLNKTISKRHPPNNLQTVNEHLYYILIATDEKKIKDCLREVVGNENKPYVIDYQSNVDIIVRNKQIE
jgi:hypothetical protein